MRSRPARAARALLLLVAAGGAPHVLADEFNACLAKLRSDAAAKGVAPQTFNTAMTGIEPDPTVLDALNYQPEFSTAIWDYLAGLVDEQRITEGQAKLAEWAPVLARAEQTLGVDRHVLVAIWGVESDYGRVMGGRSIVRSLASLSCFGHRQRFFRGELIAALRILQSGDVPPESLKGSWAGAFGQTQFMPTTFQRLAVDFDGDGRRDIVGSVADALGSTANFLSRAGWVSGEPWGYEVSVPPDYSGPSGRRNRQPLAKWGQLGIRRVDGTALTSNGPAALLLPAGTGGPAFLVHKNFDVIYSYNAAESYALAIAHLSDRLRGAGPLQAPWPTDDPGLSRAERREVQQRLIERGFDIGQADGIVGARTRAAVEAFQSSAGLTVDGRAGTRVLRALRAPNQPQSEPAAPAETAAEAADK